MLVLAFGPVQAAEAAQSSAASEKAFVGSWLAQPSARLLLYLYRMLRLELPPHFQLLPPPQLGSLSNLGGSGGADTTSRTSKRRPSATLAIVLMKQLQFLATLSLVNSVVREDSWLSDFILGLRCDHCTPPVSILPSAFSAGY